MEKKDFMDLAIDLSDDNFDKKYGGPFGACVVKGGTVVGKGINRVIKNQDPTAHAEIVAIREACKKLGTNDLSGCALYTSCFPCPMCLAASIWANIKVIYYANTKEDADKIGFRDDFIYEYIDKLAKGTIDKKVLNLKSLNREDAIKVFEQYSNDENKITY